MSPVTMRSQKSVGRSVGIMLPVHLAVGLFAPFVLLDRVRGTAGFVVNAAASPAQLRAAVLLLFVGSAIPIGIAIAAFPVFRRYSSAMAVWLLSIAVAGFSLQAVDNGALLTLFSLSQEYAKAGAAKIELFQALAVVAGSARKWVHYAALFVAVCWMFQLFALLFRFRLVPRVLAGVAMLAALLQITGVTLRGFLGYPPEFRLAIPLAPAYVAVALWLMVKGFDERFVSAEAHGVEVAEVWNR